MKKSMGLLLLLLVLQLVGQDEDLLFSSGSNGEWAKFKMDEKCCVVEQDGQKVLEIIDSRISHWITLPEAETIRFTVWAKGVEIRSLDNRKHWFGSKFGLMMPIDGKTQWPGAPALRGNFDWKQLSFKVDVPQGKPLPVMLMIGLDGATGKLYLKDLKVEIIK